MDRRQMLKVTGATLAGSSLFGVPAWGEESIPETQHTKKALIIGAHPDDPETGCGGTMILLKQAGYEVVSVYMTKGEGGIIGKTPDEAIVSLAEANGIVIVTTKKNMFETSGRLYSAGLKA